MLRHKTPFLHTAYKDARPQDMERRLRESRRQQHPAAVDDGRPIGQRRERFSRKGVPCLQTLRRDRFPAGIPAAGVPPLHGFPAGAAVFPPCGTGIFPGLSGLRALFAALFPGVQSRCQPEFFLGGVLAQRGQGARGSRFHQPCHKMSLAALTGPDAAHFGDIQRQPAGAVGFALAAEGSIHIAQCIGQRKFWMSCKERRHLPLVLLGCKGAGGIDQLPARSQNRRGTV